MKFEETKMWTLPAKICIYGPSFSGKTTSALLLAKGLVGNWKDIGIVDTENNASAIARKTLKANFRTLNIAAPFHPDKFIEAIRVAIESGVKCLVIDSLTHEWNGPGGCLELHAQATQAHPKNDSYASWSVVTPMHDRLLQYMVNAPIHIIVCFRASQEYVKEAGMNGGKTTIRKLGIAPETRKNSEYEFSYVISIDDNHYYTAMKDRSEGIDTKGIFQPSLPEKLSEDKGKELREWMMDGEDPIDSITNVSDLRELTSLWNELGQEAPQLQQQTDVIDAFKAKSESLKQTKND
jgi:hypothetical protein